MIADQELKRAAPPLIAFALAIGLGTLLTPRWGSPAVTPDPLPVPSPTKIAATTTLTTLERGRRLFHDAGRTACVTCHQDAGPGNGPSLRGVGERYLAREKTREAAADAIARHVREPDAFPGLTGHKWPVKMVPYSRALIDDEELDAIVAFLISRTGDLPVSGAIAPLDEPDATPASPPSAERGDEIAHRERCTSCHSTREGAKAATLAGAFDGFVRSKGSTAGARQALASKLAAHSPPLKLDTKEVPDLIEFLRQAR